MPRNFSHTRSCLYLYICTYTCVCISISHSVSLSLSLSLYIYTHLPTHTHTHTHTHTQTHTNTHTHTHTHTYVCRLHSSPVAGLAEEVVRDRLLRSLQQQLLQLGMAWLRCKALGGLAAQGGCGFRAFLCEKPSGLPHGFQMFPALCTWDVPTLSCTPRAMEFKSLISQQGRGLGFYWRLT